MSHGFLVARVGVAFLLVALPFALMVAAQQAPSRSVPFSAYEDPSSPLARWRAELLRQTYEWDSLVTGPQRLDDASDPARTVYLVVAAERAYSPSEVRSLQGFVARGGHLFILDVGPIPNVLLGPMGVAVSNRTLADPQAPLQWVPVNASAAGVDAPLWLQRPSALILSPEASAQVLAFSGASSFLDVDEDGTATAADLPGPFPVAASVRGPGGSAHVVVADLSLTIASDAPANPARGVAFLVGLVRLLLPDRGVVLIDEARHALPADEEAAYAVLDRLHASLGAPEILRVVVGVALAGILWVLIQKGAEAWGPHRPRLMMRPWFGPEPERQRLRGRLALVLLARKANLPLIELERFPPDRLASLVPHDAPLRAALQGRATEDDWRSIESRLSHANPEK